MAITTTQYKKLSTEVTDSAHKIWLAGLGTADTVQEESARMMKESTRLFDRMVARGRSVETKGKQEVEKVTTKASREVEGRMTDLQKMVDQRITEALHRFGIPTRKEIQTLTTRVEKLNAQVALMVDAQTEAAAAPVRTVYHVAPAEEGWKVTTEGTETAISVHTTKDDALSAARDMARAQEPSQVVVHKMDGTIQNSFAYGEPA